MAINIAALLDKAKVIHKLPSDYKLALVMGISHSALVSYRQGKTLPDARVISLLCDLTNDDPDLIAVQIEEVRAKSPEAKNLWHSIAERLAVTARTGAVAGVFSVVGAGAVLGGFPSGNAHAAQSNQDLTKIYIVEYRRRCRRSTTQPTNRRRHPPRAVSKVPRFFDQFREVNHVSQSKTNPSPQSHVARHWKPAPSGRCSISVGA